MNKQGRISLDADRKGAAVRNDGGAAGRVSWCQWMGEEVYSMVEIPFAAAEVVLAVVWLLVRVGVWLKQKKIDVKREAVLLLMYINLAVILRFTFFPMNLVEGYVQPLVFDPATAFPFRINWLPFVNLFRFNSMRDLLLNVIGNPVLFIPTGILLPIICRRLNTFWKVLLAGAGISLCIEKMATAIPPALDGGLRLPKA